MSSQLLTTILIILVSVQISSGFSLKDWTQTLGFKTKEEPSSDAPITSNDADGPPPKYPVADSNDNDDYSNNTELFTAKSDGDLDYNSSSNNEKKENDQPNDIAAYPPHRATDKIDSDDNGGNNAKLSTTESDDSGFGDSSSSNYEKKEIGQSDESRDETHSTRDVTNETEGNNNNNLTVGHTETVTPLTTYILNVKNESSASDETTGSTTTTDQPIERKDKGTHSSRNVASTTSSDNHNSDENTPSSVNTEFASTPNLSSNEGEATTLNDQLTEIKDKTTHTPRNVTENNVKDDGNTGINHTEPVITESTNYQNTSSPVYGKETTSNDQLIEIKDNETHSPRSVTNGTDSYDNDKGDALIGSGSTSSFFGKLNLSFYIFLGNICFLIHHSRNI